MRPSKHSMLPLLVSIAGVGLSALGCGGTTDTNVFPSSSAASGTGGGGGSGGSGGGGAGGATSSSSGTGGEMLNCVLDGVLTPPEQCDDGNQIPGDGCELDCSFTCTKGTVNGDAKCDDLDPCNGAETCTDQHTCQAGTPADDGTPCGQGKICKAGVCGDDVCGDLFVSAGEACDDGNATNGDGCDTDCTFSCTAADPTKCAPADPCEGQAACDDATHTCLPLAPLADGTACGPGAFCLGGACKAAQCGDGTLDPGEPCDDGNAIDGDGCDTDCTFSCALPAVDCPAAPACQMASCTAQHTCQAVADPGQNGKPCPGGQGFTCQNGACTAPSAVCGNGLLEPGEACDFGGGNGPGTGCEANCTFSCAKNPDSCVDQNPCNGVEACTTVTVNGKTGQQCQPGAPAANCTPCPGGLCGGGACKASTCGDGCVDAASGEQCEPPGTPTCDAACHAVAIPVCGNGVREGAEQCDDGNTTNLDGCDAACKFEQDQRVNWLKMQFATDAYCAANALGGAFVGGTAQGQVQQSLDDGIAGGSIDVLFKMLGLDDLSGTSDPSVNVGVLNGSPETLMGMLMYDGTNDLDWWYNVDPTSIDASRNPITSLPGSISAKVLNAGPGTVNLTLILAGVPAPLKMTQTKVTGTIGAVSAPLASNGQPPGHLASEHLDPALTSFATAGQQTANGAAKLCGNVTAASLAQVPIPASLAGGGLFACSQNYATTSSILDVLIGGCTVFFIQQIKPTQPDQVDASVPQPGAGGLYKLSANAQTRVVDTCRDKNNQVVNLAACLQAAAYSSFFKFTTDRVIIK